MVNTAVLYSRGTRAGTVHEIIKSGVLVCVDNNGRRDSAS